MSYVVGLRKHKDLFFREVTSCCDQIKEPSAFSALGPSAYLMCSRSSLSGR